ncbi:MAG: transporter [Luteolibacter sp.]
MLPKILILSITATLPLSAAPLRDMSTDRPDATESPITVDAGHFQIESTFFDYSRDRENGVKSEVFTYGSLNLKAGLLDNVDLQIVLDSFIEETTKSQGVRTTVSGFGDLQARVKINFWGNDGGATALGLMPFVKIPTGTAVSNGEWEGGIILPFSMELTEKIGLGLMAEADFVHTGDDYATEFVHSAVIGYDLTDKIGTFIEYIGVAGSEGDSSYRATAQTGITYALSENMMLDTGVRVGLNDAAEDFGVFVGGSIRY